MPFALMAVLLLPLLLAPVSTARLEAEALAEERRQIGFDNAAIVLGQSIRATLRALDGAERMLHALEVGHHALHACALAKPACRAADLAVERTIRALHQAAESAFRRGVAMAPAAAQVELRRGRADGRIAPARFSLARTHCELCRLPIGWRVRSIPAEVAEPARPGRTRPGRTRIVRWEREGSTWDYRVFWKSAPAARSWN
jgi:hypothetical protein